MENRLHCSRGLCPLHGRQKSTEGVDLETLRMRIDLSLTLAQEAVDQL